MLWNVWGVAPVGHRSKLQDTLIAALRRSTAKRHADIETLLGLDALNSPFQTGHYGQVLRGFDLFLSCWEPDVSAVLPAHLQPWFEARRRGALARGDLLALGLERVSLPSPPRVALGSFSSVLGSLYVMEGSALGGQVIARQMAQSHGIGPGDGASYFNGFGSRTGAMWREFQQMLNAYDCEGADHAQACRAANDTFEALGATFTQVLHASLVA